jgi:hypothetical protein
MASTDTGATWVNKSSGTMHELKKLRMVSSTHGWAVGYGGSF